jgi:hypothetical protein
MTNPKIFIALLVAACLMSLTTSAQKMVDSTHPKHSNLRQAKWEYKKATTLNTMGFVCVGAALVTGGVALRRTAIEAAFLPITLLTNDVGFTRAQRWWGASAIFAAGSIPFFVVAGKHTRAARLLPYANAGVPLNPGLLLPGTQTVGVSLQLPLASHRRGINARATFR